MANTTTDYLFQALRRLPIFAEITEEDTLAICRQSRHFVADRGELIITEGTEGGTLLVILSGEVEITKGSGASEVVLASRGAGDLVGEMSFLQNSARSANVRAVGEVELIEIGPEVFRMLLERNPALASTILRVMADRLRATETSLVQSEKLASLGTLAAGLAHELNNPAAAIQSSGHNLLEVLAKWRRLEEELRALPLSDAENAQLAALTAEADEERPAGHPAAAVEDALIERLEDLAVDEAWDVGPGLAAGGWTVARVDTLAEAVAPGHLSAVLRWQAARLAARQIVGEITMASAAISRIVNAVKSYSYLDRAPVQLVDIPASLEDTLVILHHKLKQGIAVERHFEPGLPGVEAQAGELNQVWTNLIDNAIHAMDGKGTLELHAKRFGESVEVRIVDSGKGIPTDVASHVFEPFFTTKAQGVGTGLGLHIVRNVIVDRHHGRINFTSRPGRTEFQVLLPIMLDNAPHGVSQEH